MELALVRREAWGLLEAKLLEESVGMDVRTVDQQFAQLQSRSGQVAQALQALAGKLQAAAQDGDGQARQWFLDLREVAIAFRTEQDQLAGLLQSIHGLVAGAVQAQSSTRPDGNLQQPPGAGKTTPSGLLSVPPQGADQAPSRGGLAPRGDGMLNSLLNSGFGQAIEIGTGFGIGDDLVGKIL